MRFGSSPLFSSLVCQKKDHLITVCHALEQVWVLFVRAFWGPRATPADEPSTKSLGVIVWRSFRTFSLGTGFSLVRAWPIDPQPSLDPYPPGVVGVLVAVRRRLVERRKLPPNTCFCVSAKHKAWRWVMRQCHTRVALSRPLFIDFAFAFECSVDYVALACV